MRAEEYFATEWPSEVPRLRRMLARNGVSLDAIDDVLQEAALRLFMAWGRVFEDRPLRPLVNTIVLNAGRDHHRRTHYEVRAVGDFPESFAVDPRGAEQIVLARLELERTGRALTALTDQQRDIVTAAVADELAGEVRGRVRAPAATRMAITRARRRLVEVLEITAVGAGLVGGSVRRGVSDRGLRRVAATTALVVGALSAAGALGRVEAPAAEAPATSAATAEGTGTDARAGVVEWEYDTSTPMLDLDFPVRTAGTSRWAWDERGLLSVAAQGAELELGHKSTDPTCVVSIGWAEVRYRCLPVSPTPQTDGG